MCFPLLLGPNSTPTTPISDESKVDTQGRSQDGAGAGAGAEQSGKEESSESEMGEVEDEEKKAATG